MARLKTLGERCAGFARTCWQRAQRAGWSVELAALVLVTVVVAVLIVVFPVIVPLITLVLPLVVGSLLLGPRQLPWFVVFVLLALALTVTRQEDMTPRTAMAIAIIFALGFIVLMTSFRRTRLGVGGMRGESMLVDLRDRILKQGRIPELPKDWNVGWELRSAGGTAFAGDFVVASRSGLTRLELVVVDVSGKGEEAGTRALLLSGAFGGLMGALPPAEFLPAANTYLIRQEWREGFATAIHISVDLMTGDYEVRSAGHPPAIVHDAGSGRWFVQETEGPLLGLVDDAEYPVVRGHLRRGDAVLLYTDGLVESRTRDISTGTDHLLGQADRVLRGDFEDAAARLIDAVDIPGDDRALLVVHRRVG
ncbi:PP2C family protein-serine/threonine phosphatase [Nocardioides yefusunii]|uniref:PP2C family protein-serine/threonine phosphatase n=1 Tax=Nocardioides yefusunii TaxID=2500546 RepID=A0ABW1QWX0_9ACTN|nr:PP2C family protein-serine/threonine phosphatase [Nocardioides yefusunii]